MARQRICTSLSFHRAYDAAGALGTGALPWAGLLAGAVTGSRAGTLRSMLSTMVSRCHACHCDVLVSRQSVASWSLAWRSLPPGCGEVWAAVGMVGGPCRSAASLAWRERCVMLVTWEQSRRWRSEHWPSCQQPAAAQDKMTSLKSICIIVTKPLTRISMSPPAQYACGTSGSGTLPHG